VPQSAPATEHALDGLSVVVADLGPHCWAGLAAAIEETGACVGTVSSLPEARRRTALLRPCATVVVGPLAPVRASTYGSLRALSRHGDVLVLSNDATVRERIDLLDSGADIVLASLEPAEVVASLAAALRRSRALDSPIAPPTLRAGKISVNLVHRTAEKSGQRLVLTPLEFDLLAYFVAHVGEALSRDRLLKNVWGYDIGGRDTVTVHVRRLRTKIERDAARPTLLHTVWGIGYRLSPDELHNQEMHGSLPLVPVPA